MEGGLALIVGRVDIDFSLDQLFNHAFNGQTSSQNERSCAVECLCVKIGCSVFQKNVENSLSVGGNCSVKWGASGMILRVCVSSGVKQLLGGVGPGESCSQMKRRFSSLVHLSLNVCTLSEQILDDCRSRVFIVKVFKLSGIETSSASRRDHEWRHSHRSSNVDVVDHHFGLGRCQHPDVSGGVKVMLSPLSSVVVFFAFRHHRLSGREFSSASRLLCRMLQRIIIRPSVHVCA